MKYILSFFLLVSLSVSAQVDTLVKTVDIPRISVSKTTADSLAAVMNTKAKKMFSQISTVTVSGYTANTLYSLKGQIRGTDTIQANVSTGTSIFGIGAGNFTTPTVNIGTITVTISLGGITVLSNTFSGMPAGVSTVSPYSVLIHMTVRDGAVCADGYIDFMPLPVLGILPAKMPFKTTVTNIDWTTSKVYDVKVSYSNTGNYLTLDNQSLFQY